MIANITNVYNFNELYNTSWSGAKQTLDTIIENDKEEEFLQFLNDTLDAYDKGLERTELNDFIWFDSDYIFES